MKRQTLLLLLTLLVNVINAQGRIDLDANNRGNTIQASSFEKIRATFSYNSVESERVATEAGEFSVVSLDGTVTGGNYGAPALPISRKLVAVPFGATPVIKVIDYTTVDYNLDDYGISKIYPHQPSQSKATKAEDVVFYYDEMAYQTRSMTEQPKTSFELLGTMRGVRLGALQIEPTTYDPTNNTLRVFNDIEIEITFENADRNLTEQTLLKTYSPYFEVIYNQLFNARTINDFYDEHPDLLKSPVKMLVIADRMFEDVMQPWIEWKTLKGFFLDVKFTDEIGTSSEDIKAYITQQYELEAPSFVILFGDEDQLPPSKASGYETQRVTDNYYASVDNDYIPDIYCSRMCCETVEEMESLIEKVLQYEQYTMPNPSYLKNALLIAGYDVWYNSEVAQPTVEYVSNYYINKDNGYDNVYKYLEMYNDCYSNLNTGVGFTLYTAHGLETLWDEPRFAVSDVDDLTNKDKYFWAVGNCCNSGDWGYNASKSLGEAMITANQKGAWGYIGSCPVTYWWEDYYFAVGATRVSGRMPQYEETTMGSYDALWSDSYNSLSSVMYSGNLAVTYSHLNNYTSSISSRYYYEAYHTLGDGSVMPYKAQPTANEVSHMYVMPAATEAFAIDAAPGSYVGISANGMLYGAGMIDETGTGSIDIERIPAGTDVTIVVTHPNHYPYIETITTTTIEGVSLVLDKYRLNDYNNRLDNGDEIELSLDIVNIGSEDAEDVVVELISDSEYINMIKDKVTVASVMSGDKVSLEKELSFKVADNIPDKTEIGFKLVATSGDESWEKEFTLPAYAPSLSINNIIVIDPDQHIDQGETIKLRLDVRNNGGNGAYNVVTSLSCDSDEITLSNTESIKPLLDAGGVMIVVTDIEIPSTVPNGTKCQIEIKASTEHYSAIAIYDIYVGSGVSLDEKADEQTMMLYPNPTTGILNIDADANVDVTIYNHQGQVVQRYVDCKNQIDMSGLEAGIYFVEINNERNHIIEKIILK